MVSEAADSDSDHVNVVARLVFLSIGTLFFLFLACC